LDNNGKIKEVMNYKSGRRVCGRIGVTVLVIVLLISSAAALLIQQCQDRNYIINSSNLIVEGTVEKVESKWNEEHSSIYTYTNISIEKYVKGIPIPGNKGILFINHGNSLCYEELCFANRVLETCVKFIIFCLCKVYHYF
jgi:hypothetical protein